MKRILLFIIALGFVSAFAEQAQSPEATALARMREAMKQLNARIASADAASAEAQAKQIEAEAKVKALEDQVKKLSGDLKDETSLRKADKETSDKKLADLEAKLKAKDEVIADAARKNAGWKAAFDQVKAAADQRGDQLADAQSRTIAAERKAQEHERKNREMYKLGLEILERYKNFGLGSALLAKEPFTGSMRVKFQNYVNDYGDKLATQRIGAAKVEAAPKKP